MEEAGLLGHPPLLQEYPNVCFPPRPPFFGAPWQHREEMHLMQFQYNHPPIIPFGMLPPTTKRKRRRRNPQRTSWIGDDGHHQNVGIQIKLGKMCQPTLNIEVDTQQLTNIVVKSTKNRNCSHLQEHNNRQKIQKQKLPNLSLEIQMPNRPKHNAALRRKNRSQRFKRRTNSVERRSRRYGFPFKPGTSPLLRDEELNLPRTSQRNPTRKCRSRRNNFWNRQNRGKIEQIKCRGIQDSAVLVTEMDEEELELVDEVVETEGDDLENSTRICSDGFLKSQVLLSTNTDEIYHTTTS